MARFQIITIGRGSSILPHNGMVNGFAGSPFPYHCCFALIGDADGCDLFYRKSGLGNEALDVIEHIDPGRVTCPIHLVAGAFGLQRREEALHRGVVPDVARPAHRTDDTVVSHQPLELIAGVLASAIGVMQQRSGLPRRRSPSLGHPSRAARSSRHSSTSPPPAGRTNR